jgi:hypothetical protein
MTRTKRTGNCPLFFFGFKFFTLPEVFSYSAEVWPGDPVSSFDSIGRSPLNGVLISWVFVPLIFPSSEHRNFKTDAAGWD